MIPLISSADQLITNFLHPVIQLSTLGGTRQKLLLQLLCLICRDIFFIAKLMFQTCPEIHGNSSKLDFHIYHFFVFLQKDRHLHDQMQASVTTGFWIFYIIFFLDQLEEIRENGILKEKEHIGIFNIQQRLLLLYGKEYGLTVEHVKPSGTAVTICIPKTKGEKGYESGNYR